MRKDDLMKADLFSDILILTSALAVVAALVFIVVLSVGHSAAMR
jgi:hypothetical protein